MLFGWYCGNLAFFVSKIHYIWYSQSSRVGSLIQPEPDGGIDREIKQPFTTVYLINISDYVYAGE